jgi:hypothetical protein
MVVWREYESFVAVEGAGSWFWRKYGDSVKEIGNGKVVRL